MRKQLLTTTTPLSDKSPDWVYVWPRANGKTTALSIVRMKNRRDHTFAGGLIVSPELMALTQENLATKRV
jgi:hypothetical protein